MPTYYYLKDDNFEMVRLSIFLFMIVSVSRTKAFESGEYALSWLPLRIQAQLVHRVTALRLSGGHQAAN